MLQRLSALEVSVQCHEANAVQQIEALAATKELDHKHNANFARLEKRIEQLEAHNRSLKDQVEAHTKSLKDQIVGYRSHNESLEQRVKALESKGQQTARLVLALSSMISDARVAAPSPTLSSHSSACSSLGGLPPHEANYAASAQSNPAHSGSVSAPATPPVPSSLNSLAGSPVASAALAMPQGCCELTRSLSATLACDRPLHPFKRRPPSQLPPSHLQRGNQPPGVAHPFFQVAAPHLTPSLLTPPAPSLGPAPGWAMDARREQTGHQASSSLQACASSVCAGGAGAGPNISTSGTGTEPGWWPAALPGCEHGEPLTRSQSLPTPEMWDCVSCLSDSVEMDPFHDKVHDSVEAMDAAQPRDEYE